MQGPTRREFLAGMGAAASAILVGDLRSGDAGAPERRPNILLFFPDQLRFDWTGANPALPLRTPNVDRLSREGVRFTNAVCPSPLCAPSRACLASGREYDRCGVRHNNDADYPLGQTTFYTLLKQAGYRVFGCGKFDLHKPSFNWGLDGSHLVREWGFTDGVDNAGKWDSVRAYDQTPVGPKDPYLAYLKGRGDLPAYLADLRRRRGAGAGATFPTPLSEEAYVDNWIAARGLALLDATPRGAPWFLQVNFNGPHPPWDITAAMERGVRGREFPLPAHPGGEQASALQAVRQNYAAMIENIDRHLGAYLDAIDRRGELGDTLVVFSSDHGEMLGDRGTWGKDLPLHPSVGVPLVVRGPGVRRGVVYEGAATTLDLTATFLDFGGVDRPEDMDSRTLRPFLAGAGDHPRTHVLSGIDMPRDRFSWRMAFDGRSKLVRGDFMTGKDEALVGRRDGYLLYDRAEDPEETTDISASAPEVVERLRPLLPG